MAATRKIRIDRTYSTDNTADATARNLLSVSAGSAGFNPLTGVISIPNNTSQLTNGAGFITASDITGKQNTLVSGTNIKTVNNTTLLGSGNLAVQATLVSGTNIKSINGTSLLGSGDLTVSGGGDTLPSQSGNNGKYLTTDGSSLSWGTVSGSGPTNYFKGLQILEDVYEASGAANIIFSSTDNSVTITRNYNNIDFSVSGGGGGGTDYSTVTEVAIGQYAANGYNASPQGANAIAIGVSAGSDAQGISAIAIGENAGLLSQGTRAIAIGTESGRSQQGNYAIGIGYRCGYGFGQVANSIILNASSSPQDASNSGLYINPIRSASATAKCLYYDTSTKEVTYGDVPSGGSGGGGGSGAFTDQYKFDSQFNVNGYDTTFTLPAGAGPTSYYIINAYIPGPPGSVPTVTGIDSQSAPNIWLSITPSGNYSGTYFISTSAPSMTQAAIFSSFHSGSVFFTMFQITSEEKTMNVYAGGNSLNGGPGGSLNIIADPTYNGGMFWMTFGNFYGRIYATGGPEQWSQLATFVPADGVSSYVDETNMFVWIKIPGSLWSQGGGGGATFGTITQTGYFSAQIYGTFFGQ